MGSTTFSSIFTALAARRRRDALIVLACVLAQATYLLTAYWRGGNFGFPLDDAWIHQTYARNLAQSGEWAFAPGVPSAGATSILWPLLLAPGHLIGLDPRWWAQIMGLAALIGGALGAARWLEDESAVLSLIAGLGYALEWHLVWAAASGMETGLFAALLIWFWVWLRKHIPHREGYRWQNGLVLGLWGGVLMLARPEGILAAGIGGLVGLLAPGKLAERARWGLAAGAGLSLILAPYFALNLSLSGEWWPNTFYAKQTEYAVLWQLPYLQRLFEQMLASLVGPQLLLLPGLLYGLWRDAHQRPVEWAKVVPVVWAVLHWAVFAARLPVTYQHGRYTIPAIPILVVLGVRGALLLARPRSRQIAVRLGSLVWLMASSVLFPAMVVVAGAPAYARDVAYIENEMVAAARWVAANTDQDELIAAHDIGALGYFAPRPLVDLAGLASPDVIPFMTDADRLTNYIFDQEAAYLIVFPDWSAAYERLVSQPVFCPVWSAAEAAGYVPTPGKAPMVIYAVKADGECKR